MGLILVCLRVYVREVKLRKFCITTMAFLIY